MRFENFREAKIIGACFDERGLDRRPENRNQEFLLIIRMRAYWSDNLNPTFIISPTLFKMIEVTETSSWSLPHEWRQQLARDGGGE